MRAERDEGETKPGQASMQQRPALQPSSTESTDVKVVVRVRPQTLETELQRGVQTCVEVEGHNVCTVRSPNETVSMPFNWVAGPATTQGEFFKVVGRPTVENCLLGFNSSIFAYGQTGSGKTYTMIGQLPAEGSSSLPADAGISPRILKYLWQRMPEVQADMLSHSQSKSGSLHSSSSSSSLGFMDMRNSLHAEDSQNAEQPNYQWLVRISIVEIHKEDVYDLLRPGSGALTIREDIRKGVYVEGLCERVVEDVSDALDVLRAGIVNRQVAVNDLNAASSRSHCIFTCHIESRLELQAGIINVRSSRLHLVDLAGSERLKTSWASAHAGNTGASVSSSWDGGSMSGAGGSSSNTRLRETTSINSSLTVLGLVILRLTEQQPHIPYRNSKLTFLLQDSIGGNAKTVIIANVSPSEACLQETLSTLGFAARARKIVNKAVVNEDHSDDVTLLRQKLKRLQQELVLARAVAAKASPGLRISDNSLAGSEATQQAAREAAQQLQEQQQQLADALQLLSELGDRNSELEQAAEFYQRERTALEQNCLEARVELAAMQVSLQQALSENKSWKHRIFKKSDKSSKAGHAPQHQQHQPEQPSPAVSPAAGAQLSPADTGVSNDNGGSSSAGKAKQQGSPGWLFGGILGRKDKAKAAAAAAASTSVGAADVLPGAQTSQEPGMREGPEQQQQQQLEQPHQQDQLQHMLHLVSTQLQELTASICPPNGQTCAWGSSAASTSSTAACTAASGSAAAGGVVLQGGGLLELQELQRQHDSLPELRDIVSTLRILVAWQQQQQQARQQQEPAADATPGTASKASSSKVAPSELHRQLFEERELTAQLHARIRQLQQELLLAGGPAVAATVALPTSASVTPAHGKHISTAARLARLSPGMGVHYSADAACMRALHVAPTVLEEAFAQASPGKAAQVAPAADQVAEMAQDGFCSPTAAAQDSQQPGGLQAEPVVVQISINDGDDSKAAGGAQQQEPAECADAAAAAAVTIAEQQQVIEVLQAQLSQLQEQLEVTQRERLNFTNRLQSAKALAAAALCSTPSSQLSSSLASPQASFGLLEPVFGSSIIEEPELDESDDLEPPPSQGHVGDGDSMCRAGSRSGWHPEPEAASSPCTSPCRAQASASAGVSGALNKPQPRSEEELSADEVWQQHHSQVQQYQLEYERREELTKAVHAAIACNKRLPFGAIPPTDAPQQHVRQQQQQQALSASEQQQQQQDHHQQQQLDLLVVSTQDEHHAGQEQRQEVGSLSQWQYAAGASGASGLQGSAHASGSSQSRDSTGSETTRSSGSTRGSYSDFAEDAASADTADAEQPAAADAAVVDADAAETDQDTSAAGADMEESQRWPSGPVWEVSDYEEEVRQLSDQLQGMVAANSRLKAVLQQRDAELAAQRELLQQQGELLQQNSHQLACSEEMMEELQERLAHSEAAAAAFGREHCDAVWLKGQYDGLKGLNEFLQEQLAEQSEMLRLQAEELQELRTQLERHAQQGSNGGRQTAQSDAQQLDASAAAMVGTPCGCTDSGTQTADLGQAHANTSIPGQSGAGAGAVDDALPHDGAWGDQECRTPRGAAGQAGDSQAAAAASCTPGSKRRRHIQGGRDGTPTGAATNQAQPMSPFKQLKVQTHALRAEPHNTQVATEQRTLLQQQIVATGLIMQQRQLEQQLDHVKQQLQEVQKGDRRKTGCADAMVRLGSPAQPDQCYNPQLEQQQQQQSPAARVSRLVQGASGSPPGAPWNPCLAAPGSSAFQQHQEAGAAASGAGCIGPAASGQQETPVLIEEAAGSPVRVARSSSATSTAVSTPRSSNASSTGDSCTDILNELSDLALDFQYLATAAHQASTFKAVSASTLRRSQQQLLQATTAASSTAGGHCCSTAASSVGSPCEAQQQQQRLDSGLEQLDGSALLHAAVALDADAAVKLQADLQVSSAFELAATRGLLHAGAVVQELRSTLANSKHSQHKHRQQHQHREHTASKGVSAGTGVGSAHSPGSRAQGKQLQRQPQEGAESPPVVRTLFRARGSGDAVDGRAALGAAVADAAAAGGAADAGIAVGSSSSPQQQGISMLRQLQQQQQYIIELLGNLAATQQQQQLGAVPGGNPAQDPLQQLADSQQQLQWLLHAAGAVIQDGHASTADSSGNSWQQVALLVGAGAGTGSGCARRQGSGAWAATGAVAGSSVGSSPTRQQRKFDGPPLLQGSSPDQQQLRDSSPDKLRRRQHAWVLSGASSSPAAQQQRLGDCSPAAGLNLQDSQRTWPAQPPADHMQEQEIAQLLQENTQMKGHMLHLRMELQRAQQRAQEAERSLISSCNSLELRSTTPDHTWAHRSQDSVSTPAGAASGVAAGFSTGATAASSSNVGTPTQLVLLSGRNKELHAVCIQREAQIRQLENELRRMQHELKQQGLVAAPVFPAGFSTAGGLTPRGAATPRHGLVSIAGPGPSLLSPQRRAVSSPGAAGTPRCLSLGAAAYGAPAAPQGAMGSLANAVSQAHHAPAPTRFGGAAQTGQLEMQPWLGQPYGHMPAVIESSAPQGCKLQEQWQQQHEGAHSAVVVRASLDDVSCASTSSSRSRGKGIRVGCGKPPLHVPSLKRK